MGTVSIRGLAVASRLSTDRLSTVVSAGVAVFAAYHLVLALWMAASPHSFFKQLGPFETFNSHYIRDLATYNAAIGVTLAVAIKRRSWRVPLLALLTVQFALHSVNHIVDINKAHPAWTGYMDAVTLVGATLVLYWLMRAAMTVAARGSASAVSELTSADS